MILPWIQHESILTARNDTNQLPCRFSSPPDEAFPCQQLALPVPLVLVGSAVSIAPTVVRCFCGKWNLERDGPTPFHTVDKNTPWQLNIPSIASYAAAKRSAIRACCSGTVLATRESKAMGFTRHVPIESNWFQAALNFWRSALFCFLRASTSLDQQSSQMPRKFYSKAYNTHSHVLKLCS